MRLALAFLFSACVAQAQALAVHGFTVGNFTNACALSAASHACYASFITHRPLLVGGLWVPIGSVTAGDTIRVSLQTMNGAFPSGTILASGTIPISAGNTNTFVQVDFGQPVHIERARRIAVVVDYPSYASGNLQVHIGRQTDGYIGLSDVLQGALTSGRYDGSSWSQYQRTTSLGVVLLGEAGVPIQMYWTPLNGVTAGTSAFNTTLSTVCVSRAPIRIEGLLVSRTASSGYSPYVTLSIVKGGATVWQTQWSDGQPANSTYTAVRVSPPVVVGAGETFVIREQGSGFVQGYRIADTQPFGASLRDTTGSVLACRPESGTQVLAAFPLVTPLPMRQSMEVEW